MNGLKNIASKLDAVNFSDNKKISEISVELIDSHKNQFYSQDKISELATSIELVGQVLHPIRIIKNGDRYVVIDGHRRVEAVKTLKMDTIPAIVLGDLSEQEQLVQLINGNHYRTKSKDEKRQEVEEMRKFLKLKGITNINEMVAQLFGISERSVYRNAEESKKDKHVDTSKKVEDMIKNFMKLISDFTIDELLDIKSLVHDELNQRENYHE